MLGFQQIKTFLENKETSYREEIQALKRTIVELLEGNELREREFEDEIKLLSGQIEAISHRYYENIEYPVIKINEKVEKELGRVKRELVGLVQENSFKEQLVALANNLRQYGQEASEENDELKTIELCMKKGNELLITIRQLVGEMVDKKA